jgi:ABC-type nitrate/sulfonate/bicarbonate transport system, ATPase component
MGAIHMNHLFYSYKDNTELVLDDINLTIENGEFVCIIGHSGCVKARCLEF